MATIAVMADTTLLPYDILSRKIRERTARVGIVRVIVHGRLRAMTDFSVLRDLDTVNISYILARGPKQSVPSSLDEP